MEPITQQIDLNKVAMLSQQQRDDAYEAARKRIAGRHPDETPTLKPVQPAPAPTQDSTSLALPQSAPVRRRFKLMPTFEDDFQGQFSPAFRWVVLRLAGVVVLGGLFESSIRVGIAAFDEFNPIAQAGVNTLNAASHYFNLNTIIHPLIAFLAAFATILTAETGQVVFTLAFAMAQTRSQKAAATIAVMLSMLVSYVANLHVARPDLQGTAWGWVGALVPPTLVFLGSFIIKTDIMHNMTTRRNQRIKAESVALEVKLTREAALQRWLDAYDNAPDSGRWTQTYALTLWEFIKQRNLSIVKALNALSDRDKYWLYEREVNASQWFNRPAPVVSVQTEPDALPSTNAPRLLQRKPSAPGTPGGGRRFTDELAAAVTETEGVWTGVCPVCKKIFDNGGQGYSTSSAAKGALSAHKRSHIAPQ